MLAIYFDNNNTIDKLLSASRMFILSIAVGFVLLEGDLSNEVVLLGIYLACQLLLLGVVKATTWRTGLGLLLDIGLLSHVIYLFDGVLSGWVSLLLLPALIGALTLPLLFAAIISLCAIFSYFVLLQVYLQRVDEHAHHMHTSMSDHLFGMLATFVVCVCLLTFFINRQMHTIRTQQKRITQLHDSQWRQRQIVSMATYSANTAHKLATPIATSKLLLEEIIDDMDIDNTDVLQLLNTAQQQLNRCETQLDEMRQRANYTDLPQPQKRQIGDWLNAVINNWWNAHNEIALSIDISSELAQQFISANQNLEFALTNLLDNSAKAAFASGKLQIDITAIQQDEAAVISLRDHGQGIERNYLSVLGKQAVESDSGMGIGLLLTQETIQESGGKLSIDSSEQGTIVRISLPLANEN